MRSNDLLLYDTVGASVKLKNRKNSKKRRPVSRRRKSLHTGIFSYFARSLGRMVRLILPILSTSRTFTVTSSPMFTTSSTLPTRLSDSLEIWIMPTLLGDSSTKAPNYMIRTTLPVNTMPGSMSVTMLVIIAMALSIMA